MLWKYPRVSWLFAIVLIWNYDLLLVNTQDLSTRDGTYMITMPKAIIPESRHKFFVEVTTTTAKIQIDTYEPVAMVSITGTPVTIEGSSGEIAYQLPIVNPDEKIRLDIKVELCTGNSVNFEECQKEEGARVFFANDSVTLPVIKESILIYGETSKPIYKPGELVRFRFIQIFPSNLKTSVPENTKFFVTKSSKISPPTLIPAAPQSNVFSIIYLEDPNKTRMNQWINVTWIKAMKLSHQLTKDPVLGTWKLVAKFRSQTKEQTFEVKKYVLPKFTVDIQPPKALIVSDEFVKFSVCAQYSTGRPMKAEIVAKLCVKNPRGYSWHDSRPCLEVTATLEDAKATCKSFKLKSKKLGLRNPTYSSYNSRAIVTAEVTESGTGIKINATATGAKLERTSFKIEVIGSEYYKPGLPYYGKIKITKHCGTPLPSTEIKVSGMVYSFIRNNQFGFTKIFKTGEDGTADFALPALTIKEQLSLQFSQMGAEEKFKPDTIHLQKAYHYKTIKPWTSVYNSFLQIYPYQKLTGREATCPGRFPVRLLATIPLRQKTILVNIMSRGQLVSSQKFLGDENGLSEPCMNRDSELGHYECSENSGDRVLIKCLPGWTGDNCIRPICQQGCSNGICIKPGECSCKKGWKGNECSECVIRKDCKNGICRLGDDCDCLPGWRGYDCDKAISNYNESVETQSSSKSETSDKPKDPTEEIYLDQQELKLFARDIQIDLDASMSPGGQIIVYFTNTEINGTEIIAESFILGESINRCFLRLKNSTLKFSKKEASPGKRVQLEMSTGCKENLCALRISDISLSTFGSAGGIDPQTIIDDLVETNQNVKAKQYYGSPFRPIIDRQCIKDDDNYPYSVPMPMPRRRGPNRGPRGRSRVPFRQRRLRSIYYPRMRQAGADSAQAFEDAGIFVMTNGRIVNRKCRRSYGYRRYYASPGLQGFSGRRERIQVDSTVPGSPPQAMAKDSNSNDANKLIARIREFFPETWKFEYLENPPKKINLTAPDSMTTWQANAYCMTEKGLWTTNPTFLKVLMPFYLQQTLPYSVKRNEVVTIPVKLFNYLSECYQVTAHVTPNPDFTIIGQSSAITCLCDYEQSTVYFKLKPHTIGKVDIVVSAQSRSSTFCPNRGRKLSGNSVFTDATKRKLLVEPEGIPQELNMGDVICAQKENITTSHQISLPENVIEGSKRIYMIFSGDVMGSALNNLDRLVKMPYGCGEQNMVSMVPSIYVIDYFVAANIEKPEIIAKAKSFIQIGYKRQLNYRREDGSYSAFGKRDKEGSTWLTAFVLKSFIEAQKYAAIEKSTLVSAIEFLGSRQNNSDGCFEEYGRVFSSTMKGGVGKNGKNTILLTAYILTALANDLAPRFMVDQALRCIRKDLKIDAIDDLNTYALALISYAINIHEPDTMLSTVLRSSLIKRAITSTSTEYWSDSSANKPKFSGKPWITGNSAEVETTAYGYLALENIRTIGESMRSARWLSNQRSSFGGYYSTQDTVMGLKALSNYAKKLVFAFKADVSIKVSMNDKQVSHKIDNNNRLVTKKIDFTPNNAKLNPAVWNIFGEGCVALQTSVLFNLPKPTKTESPLTLTVNTAQSLGDCKIATASICFSYTSKEIDSNMLLLSVEMVSGWLPSKNFLIDILNRNNNTNLKRVEFDKRTLSFYFDPIDAEDNAERCLEIDIYQKDQVDDAKGATVTLNDYYSPEISIEKTYTFENCIPIIEDDFGVPPTFPPADNCPQYCYRNELPDMTIVREKICSSSRAIIAEPIPESRDKRLIMLRKTELSIWLSSVILNSDKCDNCFDPKSMETMVYLTSISERVTSGSPLVLNSNFIVVKASDLTATLRRASWCPNAIMLGQMLASVYAKAEELLPVDQRCPACLNNIDEKQFPLIKSRICSGVAVDVKFDNNTSESNTLEANNSMNLTTIRVNYPDCLCSLNDISNLSMDTFSIVMPSSSTMKKNNGKITLNGNHVVLKKHLFKQYKKMCTVKI